MSECRHGQSALIRRVLLNDSTREYVTSVLLTAYEDGYLRIEAHADGEAWLSTGDDETLVITLPADSAAEYLEPWPSPEGALF